ncbi:mitochondrial glycoprotein [Xylaria sp. FL0933]|nr:mitochondrial glycoprotein [Xylaria sp. FL0933]
MMSLRAAARSAPRTLSRMSSTAIRQTKIAQPSSLLRTAWAPLRTPQLAATFSSTPLRQAPANEADQELLAKLESELQFEDEMKANEQLPASIKDFVENSPYELKDEAGQEDVYLVRKMGNETITVSFSISDLANYEPDDVYNEDSALTDEELDTPEGKRLAETEAQEGLEEEEPEAAVPCRLNIVVEKANKGALNIEAIAQDGSILVENFYYYKDPKMAHSSTPEAVHGAEDVYPGPPFGSLDEDLQLLMERYLEERGISQAMALFVPDYMNVKEQREYQTWLKNVKDFVEA